MKTTSATKKLDLKKQYNFALATTLTACAQEAQRAVIQSIQKTFTVRSNWYEPKTKVGIKVQPAKKDNPVATISTLAWWLESHESGVPRVPRGNFLAIPGTNVRRTKRDIVSRATRARLLNRSNKEVFVFQSKKGPILAQRLKNGHLKWLFGLEKSVRIKKKSTFYEPIKQVFTTRLQSIWEEKLAKALETAK